MRAARAPLLIALSVGCVATTVPISAPTPAPAPASAPARSLRDLTVGVAPFAVDCPAPCGVGLSGNAIAEDLATVLAALPGVRVVEVRQLDQVREELQLQGTGLVDDRQLTQPGRWLGAKLKLVGSAVVRGGQVRLNGRMIQVETEEILRAAARVGPIDELFRLEDELARELAGASVGGTR